MNEILSQIPDIQYIALGFLTLLFILQIAHLAKWSSVANHKHRFRLKNEADIPPVSLIVVVQENDEEYVYQQLPKLLDQDHPNYEVVVVNDCGGNGVTDALNYVKSQNDKLKFTVIKADDKFRHSRKIALVVGIKAAKFENLVFTDTCIVPTSNRWLSFMARGFVGAKIVISYAGFGPSKGVAGKLIKASWLDTAVKYLNAAIKGKTYRGTMYNIGYTKDIFFKSRGFTHLRLAMGEDDLFIQKIAKSDNVAVIVNHHTTVRMELPNEKLVKWWWNYKKFHSFQYRYYPSRVKLNDFGVQFTKFIYMTSMAASLSAIVITLCGISTGIVFPYAMLAFVVTLAAIREFLFIKGVKQIFGRLGEKHFFFGCFVFDKISPITSLFLAISRRVRPPADVWR